MKILLLSSSYNSLTQRTHVELADLGHEISVELATSETIIRDKINSFKPELILCPMLKFIIPKDLWKKTPCIIVHPGIKGDRGASSLDWAILLKAKYWGVTLVQAADEVDSGPVWATCEFKMREGSKSSIYRDELSGAAIRAIKLAVKRFEVGHYVPEPLDYSRTDVQGKFRGIMKQKQRAINWQEDSASQIILKIRSADSNPGLLDNILGLDVYLYGAHREGVLIGSPGKLLAKRYGAICIATIDGAVWITHLRRKGSREDSWIKLPATRVLGELVSNLPESRIDLLYSSAVETYKEIWYREQNEVGYLYFEFYNGAMSTEQCERLNAAFKEVSLRSQVKVLVLMGGRDFWSNGIHLNVIEAAKSPSDESWRNINAMNQLVHSIIHNTRQYVISAMHGNAGAGGVMMALAADKVLARECIVLNPHYRSMGGLYGSEYWTYLLPKRTGKKLADEITTSCLPMSADKACRYGIIDGIVYEDEFNPSSFHDQIVRIAEKVRFEKSLPAQLEQKQQNLEKDNEYKPIERYKEEELSKMRLNFYGEDMSYHTARSDFVHKIPITGSLPEKTIKPAPVRHNGSRQVLHLP